MTIDQQLDQAIDFSQDVLDIFNQNKTLNERIKHRGNNVYIELDKTLVELFDDIGVTLKATKTLFDQTKQFGNVPNQYIKYFRLLQQNGRTLATYLEKVLEDSRIRDKLGQLVSAGKAMVEMFVTVTNNVIDAINKKIATPLLKIEKLKDLKFTVYKGDIPKPSFVKNPEFQPSYQQWMEESVDNRVHTDEEVKVRIRYGEEIFAMYGYTLLPKNTLYYVQNNEGEIISDRGDKARLFTCAEEAYDYCITDDMLDNYLSIF